MGEAIEAQDRAQDRARAQAQKRSSSQASTSSRRSQKAKTVRSKPLKRLSTCSSTHTATDLTSFPSLSPDRSPEGFFGEPALNHALSRALLVEEGDKGLDGERGRKATLEGLTTTLPQLSGRAALFSDSAPSQDVPGSLHLANDDHIERLIARTGAVRLIRQFARDLALRDAEVSALRLRADDRERELKKMLREVEVSNHDIERRLYMLENPPDSSLDTSKADSADFSSGQRSLTSSIDDMMNQAMLETVGPQKGDIEATIRPHRTDSDPRSGNSSAGSSKKPSTATGRGWQDYIWGTSTVSRRPSRANSMRSDAGDGPRIQASNRRKALDGQLFQPPGPTPDTSGLGIDGTPAYKSGDGDDRSIISQRSSNSVASWTVKLFAGKGKDGQDGARSRASSRNPDARNRNQSPAPRPPKAAGSALAALTRINGSTGVQQLSGRSSSSSTMRGSTMNNTSKPRRLRVSSTTSGAGTPGSAHPDSEATNLGPVEMDAILPMESRPPTLAHIYGEYNPGDLLTDRFGFIYDQRRNRRQREVNAGRPTEETSSATNAAGSANVDNNGNTATPAPGDDLEGSAAGLRRWQDYLKTATKPTELLSHTPAAGPVVSVEQGTQPKPRISSIAVGKSGAVSVVNNSAQPSAFTSAVISNHAEFAGTEPRPREASTSEQQPVKLLLQRLTELHDASQQDRTVKWNEFMRKVRAERRKEGEATAALTLPDRSKPSRDMPEVALADGEVIGIAGLGNKGKIGRAKWREFRNLVLGGIPVAYRAKVWSECSGASALRVPGYYDDLVNGHITTQADPGATAQIGMDIHRTLTDNIFFRKGPGVAKLNEVLLAYSRRNPEVGYCQGMNLIAGSLLLILPTAEDAFWVLASIIENILPPHYYDHGLVASRADQQVLCQYVSEVLPNLWAHFEDLGIELEALTFQWFLSIFTDCLSAEALYRVWDVVFCLSAPATFSSNAPASTQEPAEAASGVSSTKTAPAPASKQATPLSTVDKDVTSTNSDGGGSTFFFQVALALLKLNEQQLLTTCSTPAAIYSYLNHQMTNHAISIDGLIQASEALRNVVKREDVLARRSAAIEAMGMPFNTSHVPK
ncbi:small G protein signaling modulator 3 [Arthroderma uncinatum]|uniref:small G protein signaling modulator 3 n=1 Tax=Arthroderma uncinatum TaxID=74035 RepID=UPI00144AD918|nr:small G protein signaling modulator 3 [Arthroderma uncinatum]KAF3482162.1 small G protein signaling modulator 3 [Arthroderma uncinatum]